MTHKYQRALVLLFVGLLAVQAATGDAAACRCDNASAPDSSAVPTCCSAHHSPAAPAPGVPAMGTPDPAGCDDCIQAPLASNPHRDAPTVRHAVADNVSAAPQPLASAIGVSRSASLDGYFCLPPPPSTVIRI